MKQMLFVALVSASLLGGLAVLTPARAAERSVTLNVDMWCAACSYIVKRSLESVDGVLGVAVSYESQNVVVRFDDGKSDVAALIRADRECRISVRTCAHELNVGFLAHEPLTRSAIR